MNPGFANLGLLLNPRMDVEPVGSLHQAPMSTTAASLGLMPGVSPSLQALQRSIGNVTADLSSQEQVLNRQAALNTVPPFLPRGAMGGLPQRDTLLLEYELLRRHQEEERENYMTMIRLLNLRRQQEEQRQIDAMILLRQQQRQQDASLQNPTKAREDEDDERKLPAEEGKKNADDESEK